MADQRIDSAPAGWEGTVEAMKGHSEISNPFALANWMQSEGYTPHDAMNPVVLDAACELFSRSGNNDGTPYVSGGAKAGNGEGDDYELATEERLPIGEHDDGGAEMNFGKEDSDEMLLDESEADGANYPTAQAPPSDDAVRSHPGTLPGAASNDPSTLEESMLTEEEHEAFDESDDEEAEEDDE